MPSLVHLSKLTEMLHVGVHLMSDEDKIYSSDAKTLRVGILVSSTPFIMSMGICMYHWSHSHVQYTTTVSYFIVLSTDEVGVLYRTWGRSYIF